MANRPFFKPTFWTMCRHKGILALTDKAVYIPAGRGLVKAYDLDSGKFYQPRYSPAGATSETFVCASGGVLTHGNSVYAEDVASEVNVRLQRPIVDGGVIYGIRPLPADDSATDGPAYELAVYDLDAREERRSRIDVEKRGQNINVPLVGSLSISARSCAARAIGSPARLV